MAIRKGQQEWKGVQKVADEVSRSQPGSRRGSMDLSSSAKKSKKENAKPEQTKADNQADQKLLNAVVAEALNMKTPKTEPKSDAPKAKQHIAKQKKEKKIGSSNDLDGSASGADDIELVKFPTAIHNPLEKHTGSQEKSDASARPASSYGIKAEGRVGANGISRSTSLRPAVTENQGKGKGKVEKSCSMADLMGGEPRSGAFVSPRKPLPSGASEYGSNGKGSAGGAGLSRSNAKKQPVSLLG